MHVYYSGGMAESLKHQTSNLGLCDGQADDEEGIFQHQMVIKRQILLKKGKTLLSLVNGK
jgi:hypothetical protein